tara:strand:- start:1520 stop:1849 length:330 start_codon:yes stop_codon:yes gene_type:complete
VSAEKISTITANWQQIYQTEFAALTAGAFQAQASVLPNRDVYNASVFASAGNKRRPAGDRSLSLIFVSDEWSVYSVGNATLAVSSHDNETLDVDSLDDNELAELGLPNL